MYIEKLKQLEKEMGVKVTGTFAGSNPNATEEDIAKELYESLVKLQAGDLERVDWVD